MVIISTITLFQCEICKKKYYDKDSADECESRPISHDKGVKLGDIILITKGESSGKKAKVDRIFIYDKDWGHYAWERYWHTIGLDAKVIGSYGHRQLTFDSYEVLGD